MHYLALTTEEVNRLRNGGLDANGQPVERAMSDGVGKPCRHCLRNVPAGTEMLILAHRPFEALHAYAECGPIFLCADECAQGGGAQPPEILQNSQQYLVKGYSADERIVYGTGEIVPAAKVEDHAADIYANPDVAFVHVRSARNNCYLARIDRE